ncbi:MAG: glycoside hydrolase family 55 protein [Bacteroidales bacterium]|nr:glycoside hydrolase family 55 protein [Bacteroidales bacterium]
MMMNKMLILIILLVSTVNVFSQSVSELVDSYSGKAIWNKSNSELIFETAGVVTFERKGNPQKHFWNVPKEVKNIIIEADVRVVCAFHTQANCTIQGKHRRTSMVYGTDLRSWDKVYKVKAFRHCQFQNFGGTLTIKNLTSLNPFGFHVRGEGNLVMVSDCDFLDNRGGSGNHSDGIEGGNGSVIENCYFETGDDVIKAYHNLTVRNCTIKMIQNAVPIQLGWGDTGNDTCNFHNLTIIGDDGRGNDGHAVIVGRSGAYTKVINIYGCSIHNPNASWISLRNKNMTVKGEVQNADIKIEKYWADYDMGSCKMTICGSDKENNEYDCKTGE